MSDFLVRELLVVAHDDDLAVLIGQFRNGGFDDFGHFVLRGGGGGREVAAGELDGEIHRAVVLSRWHGERPFAIDGALGTGAVAAVGVDDAVLRDLPQPQVVGHARLGQVLLEAAIGLDQNVLHDVADVDSPLNSLVEAKLDHPPERIAVAVQEAVNGVRVALLGIGQQILGFFRVGPHKRIITRNAECGTRSAECRRRR